MDILPPSKTLPTVGSAEPDIDAISVIETELLTLVRHLETFGRKGSLYVEVDRAGYLVLRTLERMGPAPTSVVAGELQLDGSTVTRQVTTLVASGFVERRSNPDDGRSSNLAITAAGRRTMRSVEHERRRVLELMFAEWNEDDRHVLGHVLTRLNVAIIEQVAGLPNGGTGPRSSPG
jgi:DNA-binding MarR family transcriptional regulator